MLHLLPSQASFVALVWLWGLSCNLASGGVEASQTTRAAECTLVVQGTTRQCPGKGAFSLCFVSLTCKDGAVVVQVHPELDVYTSNFEGVRVSAYSATDSLLHFTRPQNLTLTQSSIDNARVRDEGLTLLSFAEDMHVTIRDLRVFNNTGRYRAPLSLQGAHLHLHHSTFVQNRATRAGALLLKDAHAFINSTAFSTNGVDSWAPQVGVMMVDNVTADLLNCSMTRNYGQLAGAMLVTQGSVVRIADTDLVNNRVTQNSAGSTASWQDRYDIPYTAGLAIIQNSTLLLDNAPMKLNRGPEAAAMLLLDGSLVWIEKTEVHNNVGGAGLASLALLPATNTTDQPQPLLLDAVTDVQPLMLLPRKAAVMQVLDTPMDEWKGGNMEVWAVAPAASSGLEMHMPALADSLLAESAVQGTSILQLVEVGFHENMGGDVTCGFSGSTVLVVERSANGTMVDGMVWGDGSSERVSAQLAC